MTAAEDRVRYEKNFETLFSKINKAATNKTIIIVFTIIFALWVSFFGLLYTDLQASKKTATENRIAVIQKINDLKVLIIENRCEDEDIKIVQKNEF